MPPMWSYKDNVLSRLEDAGARILRTDELGDILFVSDGKTVTLPEIDDG